MTERKNKVKAPKTSQKPTSIPFRKIPWSTLDALGSFLSAVLAAFALFVGISQFNSQTEELKYEREQRIKLDRPILSIDKNSVFDFKGIKQIKLVIKNVGVRPAYSLEINTIVLRRNNELSPVVYNQKDYAVNYSNPIFNQQEVNFVNNLLLLNNAEYFIKVTLKYYEENREGGYTENFYFKWKHTEDKDYFQDALYGIERDLAEQIDGFIKKNKNNE